MRDTDQARLLLNTARRDLRALDVLADPRRVDVEIFGFHAQQAVEKALKAWLCLAGVEYPWIHDLEQLFNLLEESGETVPSAFRSLEILTDFAVQFRYTPFDGLQDELDRPMICEQVAALVDHVEALLAEGSQQGPD